jgi:protease PrsW
VWRFVLLVAAVLLLAGCSWRPPGTHDVAYDYRIESSTPDAAAVALKVRRRLDAVRVYADVKPISADRVRVVVDASLGANVRAWVPWRGDLRVLRLAPGEAPAPETPSVVDLHDAWAISDGKRLVVVVPSSADIERIAADLGDEPLAFAIAQNVLWRGPLREAYDPHRPDVQRVFGSTRAAIVVSAGDDVGAYLRARTLATLLDTHVPPLELVETSELLADWPLAMATVLAPLVVGLAWIAFVRRFDRAQPEPRWLVLATFGLGALAELAAGFVEHALWHATPYLDPYTMVLDGSAVAFFVDLGVTVVSVGIVEEGAKLLAAWSLAMHRREFDEPIDGIVYAAAASIGFATMEAVKYFAAFRLDDYVVAARSVDTFIGHAMYGAIWGYAFGKRLLSRKRARVWPWFGLAVLLHALWDTSIAFRVPHATLVLNVVLTTLFVVLVRRALRWGSVADMPGDAPPSARRALFAMKRPGALAVSLVGLYGFGAWLMGVARPGEAYSGGRGGLWSSLWGDVLVLLFGGAAWGATRAMPLDAAVDEVGVTFAGALRRWPDIQAVDRVSRRVLVLRATGGDLRIGPGNDRTLDALEAVVMSRVGKVSPAEP